MAKLSDRACGAAKRCRRSAIATTASLATIGRKRAVTDFGKVRLSGFIAWVLWSVAHIYFLIGFRSRTIVALHWLWSYMTFQRGTRLITGTARVADGRGGRGPKHAYARRRLTCRADLSRRSAKEDAFTAPALCVCLRA